MDSTTADTPKRCTSFWNLHTTSGGVDRTTLSLDFEGHKPDIEAMKVLYGDFIEASEYQYNTGTYQFEPQNGPLNKNQEVHEPQNGPLRLLDAVKNNPKITKAALSELLGVSRSTLKRWLKANDVVWVGHSKTGHWILPD